MGVAAVREGLQAGSCLDETLGPCYVFEGRCTLQLTQGMGFFIHFTDTSSLE